MGAECDPSTTDGVNETEIAALSIAVDAGDALDIEIFVAGFGAEAKADCTAIP